MLSIASWDTCDSSIFLGFFGRFPIIVTYPITYLILCRFPALRNEFLTGPKMNPETF